MHRYKRCICADSAKADSSARTVGSNFQQHKKRVPTVAVIGHLVWDRIINPAGDTTEALGGTAYNLTALGAIGRSSIKVLPVCNVGYDLYDKAEAFFGRFPAIDFSCVNKILRKNKIHELTYIGNGNRDEINIGSLPMITPELFSSCKKLDLALINYIGGDEFPPRYLKWLKNRFKPLIYLDYHSLSLGRIRAGRQGHRVKRHLRYHTHWRKYTSQADIVQMNSHELKSIFADMMDEPDSIAFFAKKILETGPRIVIITREEKGVVVISRVRSRLKVDALPAYPVKKVIDPTGCGDSFAAGFIISYLKYRNLLKACNNGLRLAGLKAGFSGLNGFFKIMA